MMFKIGLVLSGGGGKGAYQIGVWKALKEFNIDRYVKFVSGTSVGALNATLFTNGDYQKAEDLWLNLKKEDVLSLDIFESIVGKYSKKVLNLKQIFHNRGLFSRDKLEEIIQKNIDFEKVSNSEIKTFVGCADVTNINKYERVMLALRGFLLDKPVGNIKYFNLQKNSHQISKILLSSSAIPGVFPTEEINGRIYYDGGINENMPIRPIAEEDVDVIIAVSLDNSPFFEKYREMFPTKKLYHIVPVENIGGFIDGTLNFNGENATKLLERGYNDTKKVLQQLYEFMLSEMKFIKNSEIILKQHDSFKELITQNEILRSMTENINNIQLTEMNSLEFLLEFKNNKDILKIENNQTLKDITSEINLNIEAGEKAIIDENIDKIIDKMKDNSKELLEFAFDGIISLASTEGRIKAKHEQKFWSRIFGDFTDKNQKGQAEIDMNFSSSIYANQKMIQRLSERSALTIDAMIGLGNKINFSMLHINKLYGKSAEQYQALKHLYKLTGQAVNELNKKIDSNTKAISEIKKKHELHDWLFSIKDIYNRMNTIEKINTIVMKYYSLTAGNWDNNYVHIFRSALMTIGVDDNSNISIYEHLKYIESSKNKVFGNPDGSFGKSIRL